MGAVSNTQIVWTETKDLRIPQGGDQTTLSALRRNIAAIAAQAEKTFSRFEPLPSYDDNLFAADVADCATAAETTLPEALKNLRVIVWPSADGKTLSAQEQKPPPPWDEAPAESLTLIGRFNVMGQDVAAFSRPVAANEDAPRFVSLVTGTGLPPGTGVYVPRETKRKPVDPKAAKRGFRLAIATVVLFAFACIWCLSVGSLSQAAYVNFATALSDAGKCPTSINPTDQSTVFGAPRQWLPNADGPGDCMKAWRDATRNALSAGKGDWWSQVKSWLAGWTASNANLSYSLRIPTLLMMVSIVLLAVSAGYGVVGRPLGLFIDNRNRMSLTRIQFALWLVIIVGGFGSYAIYNVGFWGDNLNWIHAKVAYATEAGSSDQKLAGWSDQLSALIEFIPHMNAALWALIGISGGTTMVSSLLMQPGTPTAPGAGTQLVPARLTHVETNPSPKDAHLSDLVLGETEEDDGVVNSTRVQAIAITGVLATIYVNLILESGDRIGGLTIAGAVHDVSQVFANMPPAGSTFLSLLAVSHGTLLGGKLLSAYRGTGK